MPDISLRAGGAAGDGIASVGEVFSRIFSRNGFHVYGHTAYQSVIRGGHVWHQARASPDRLYSLGDGCDILYALDRQTADIHVPALRQGGVVVHDPEKFSIPPEKVPAGVKVLSVPTLELARKFASESILQNAVGMGACAELAGVPLASLHQVLNDQFRRKKDVLAQNIGASQLGYEFAQQKMGTIDRALPMKGGAPKLLLTGNQAIGLGAASAGMKFLAQYPMTPASTVMHWLAAHASQFGIVVKQAEDELAAINMAIGASYAGVRAMTATSGGGFSLMVEAFGMAGMTETPLVVVEAQRAGPSTGLPTKTEQGDLNMMLGASQGDFPRVILAPGSVQEAFHATRKAFELAEDFQTPVILASDFGLSENTQSVDREDLPLDYVPRSLFVVPEPADGSNGYKRFRDTPSGVSPRAIPGQKGLNFIAGSDEHDEAGHLISDVYAGVPMFVDIRKKMMEKRMRKLDGVLAATPPPTLEGPASAEVTIVGWGSTSGPVRDAMPAFASKGISVNYLNVAQPFPMHAAAVATALKAARKTLLIEANYTGQLGRLIRAETGLDIPHKLLKYDGEPIYPWEIVAKVLEVTGRVRS
jgi:2-oxoglutarate/2-oxoacid ferredoxin oxidoreductase subunit alpha